MKKFRYVSVFLNGDIGKGTWVNAKKTTVRDMQFMADVMNSNKFIKSWYIEWR